MYTPIQTHLYCNWCSSPYAVLEKLRLCGPDCSALYWGVYHKQEGVAMVDIEDECSACGKKVFADVMYIYKPNDRNKIK